ncbi:MAG: hypothetical protein J0H00_01780 [Burkholderiales bacterium]|nr:hypothetical protein [Burkholderiales bacterium]OJX07492.1 MAG: hypothetical protein BGO72_08560 [Burkholderiales bacterium 70-64]
MNDEFKKAAINAFGYTEEQVESLSAKQQAIIKGSPARRAYKMVMEVVAAENCGYKPKIGDRYVANGSGMLLTDECTFPVCLWALAPMLPISYVIFDRLTQGLDPNGHLYDHMKCTDTGVGCGGIGEVAFKVHCEKA